MEKIPYDRLLYLARKMHLEIFLMTSNEEEVYNHIGLTDEENAILGYSGTYYIKEKEEESEN